MGELNAQVTLTAESGFRGVFKYQSWIPLKISALNQGPPLRAGTELLLEPSPAFPSLSRTVRYRDEVFLDAGARRIWDYLVPSDYALGSLKFRLLDPDSGVPLREMALQTESRIPSDFLVLVFSQKPSLDFLLPSYVGRQRAPEFVYLDPAEFPRYRAALDGVDAVVFDGTSPASLSEEGFGVLRSWIDGGGTLVLNLAERSSLRDLAFLETFLPIKAGDRSLKSVSSLGSRTGAPQRLALLDLAATPSEKAGIGLAGSLEEGGSALKLSFSYGKGKVDVFAFDAVREDLRDLPELRRLWTASLEDPDAGPTPRRKIPLYAVDKAKFNDLLLSKINADLAGFSDTFPVFLVLSAFVAVLVVFLRLKPSLFWGLAANAVFCALVLGFLHLKDGEFKPVVLAVDLISGDRGSSYGLAETSLLYAGMKPGTLDFDVPADLLPLAPLRADTSLPPPFGDGRIRVSTRSFTKERSDFAGIVELPFVLDYTPGQDRLELISRSKAAAERPLKGLVFYRGYLFPLEADKELLLDPGPGKPRFYPLEGIPPYLFGPEEEELRREKSAVMESLFKPYVSFQGSVLKNGPVVVVDLRNNLIDPGYGNPEVFASGLSFAVFRLGGEDE